MRIVYTTLALMLCLSSTTFAQPQPARWTGTVDLTIGGSDADENATFGRIVSLAVDRTGRIVVADRQDNQLKIFSRDGAFVSRMGRKGAGPLEFTGIASIGFGPDGLLWVRDEGNVRLLGIDVAATPAKNVRTVPLPQMSGGNHVPFTFNPDGSIVDESILFDKSIESFRPLKLRRTLAGTISRTDTLVVPPGANDNVKKVVTVQKDANGKEIGVSERYFSQPYGPEWHRAYGPSGVRAEVVTSRYEVKVFDDNGKFIRTLTRNVPPVALSTRERHVADSLISAIKQSLPFGVPANKPPIVNIKFSSDGGLWVERTVEDGHAREADVFDRNGRLIAIATWPREIEITRDYRSVVAGTSVVALSTDASEIERIVRLRFR
ncbi:MAG: 6-bladed beta-propeller [Gemmatimonas sp.]